eukprot:TRINITY_DN16769_c0_g2_i1.p1 TRINITY_DN16769_c0_g2~~TRINITY_DN16769_c0_g2_i1.p1  ORF type:complete len:148 (-),score=29.07 TRINITY_DN16769_c0_g2_i1:53-475(-)
MDFIHRFMDDKDNKFRYDQYIKWKDTYNVLVDENEELRQQNSNDLQLNMSHLHNVNVEEYEGKISSLNHRIQAMEQESKQKSETLQQQISILQASKEEMQSQHDDLQNNYAELTSKIQLQERKYLMEREAMKDEFEKKEK